MVRRVRVAVSVVGLVAVVGLGGCSSDGVDATAEANQAYCATVGEVRTEVAELLAMLGTDASRADLELQAETVRNTAINAVLDAKELEEAVGEQLKAAGTEFKDALATIPDEAVSIEDARAQATSAAQAYLVQVEATAATAGCPAA